MARKSSKPIPVDWKTLQEQLAVYDDRQSTDAAGQHFFREAVDGEQAWDAMEILLSRGTVIEQAILDGRTQDALGEAGCLIIDIKARVMAMARAVNAAKVPIQKGIKATNGSKTGTENLTAQTQIRYYKINAWIAEKMKGGSRVSLTERRKQAAAHFKVDYKTVLRAQKTIRGK